MKTKVKGNKQIKKSAAFQLSYHTAKCVSSDLPPFGLISVRANSWAGNVVFRGDYHATQKSVETASRNEREHTGLCLVGRGLIQIPLFNGTSAHNKKQSPTQYGTRRYFTMGIEERAHSCAGGIKK